MKTILLVDASPMFKNLLMMKFEEQNIKVEFCESQRDAFTKTISLLPDLVIGDISDNFYGMSDYLDRKYNNPNSKNIPVVLCGPVASDDQMDDFIHSGVVKYFNKPVRFDVFFDFLGKTLKTVFSMDTTPCILEMHLNGDILFIEVAQGLNRDKLALLKYKIPEILDKTKLHKPKVIIMLTDLHLSFYDGINLETLITAVLSDRRVKAQNVKVLSFDSFTKELVEGHSELNGIDVVTNLQKVLSSVANDEAIYDTADFINDRILKATDDINVGSLGMAYDPTMVGGGDNGENQALDTGLGISSLAIVDSDPNVIAQIQNVFSRFAKVYPFRTSQEFLSTVSKQHYDVTILELNLPGMTGLDVLKVLMGLHYTDPVMVYSSVIDKVAIYKAISLGARTYLAKPQKPEALLNKVKDLVRQDF